MSWSHAADTSKSAESTRQGAQVLCLTSDRLDVTPTPRQCCSQLGLGQLPGILFTKHEVRVPGNSNQASVNGSYRQLSRWCHLTLHRSTPLSVCEDG